MANRHSPDTEECWCSALLARLLHRTNEENNSQDPCVSATPHLTHEFCIPISKASLVDSDQHGDSTGLTPRDSSMAQEVDCHLKNCFVCSQQKHQICLEQTTLNLCEHRRSNPHKFLWSDRTKSHTESFVWVHHAVLSMVTFSARWETTHRPTDIEFFTRQTTADMLCREMTTSCFSFVKPRTVFSSVFSFVMFDLFVPFVLHESDERGTFPTLLSQLAKPSSHLIVLSLLRQTDKFLAIVYWSTTPGPNLVCSKVNILISAK